MECCGQSSDSHQIEILWHDFNAVNAKKSSRVAELKQFCKKEWARIPPLLYVCVIVVQLCDQRATQTETSAEPASEQVFNRFSCANKDSALQPCLS